MKDQTDIFKKVVILGPDMTGQGGISSVLATYRDNMKGLRFRRTNSKRGTLAGLFVLGHTMIQLIFDRISGRKIAHIHYASGKSWIRKKLLMRYTRMLGYNVVAHCHSAQMDQYAQEYGIEKFTKALSKAKVNIVLSPQWKNFFDSQICCGNVEIVNNIVNCPTDLTMENNNSVTTFLFLGAIGNRKGIFDILEAMSRLKEAGQKLRLIVGGNGEVDRFEDEVKRLGLEKLVDFRGWITGEQKDELLRTCDVLMLPSYAEGLPISILEAMAYGRAVIATPVGGITEVVHDGENGIIVEPGNIDSIAAAMERYIKDPTLSRKHGNAALDIVQPYYAPAVRARLIELYNRALR